MEVRDLGVIFDCFLNFRSHYNDICSITNRMLIFIHAVYRTHKEVVSSIKVVYSYNWMAGLLYCSVKTVF